jgi:uncharacterized protein YjgD (DUF1641 family)
MPYQLKNILSRLDDEFYSTHKRGSIYHDLDEVYHSTLISQLSHIIATHRQNPAELIQTLKECLDEHWTLINSTCLGYTARPNHPLTKLLCDIAGYVAQEINKTQPKEKAVGIIQILMPTVGTVSASDDYQDLAPSESNNFTDVAIKTVLQTHIAGREGKVLIPIQIITEYDDSVGLKKLANPYFDYKHHADEMAFLDTDETLRLIEHSTITRDLFDAKTAFETHTNDQNNLLGHLTLLITHLKYNSVKGIGDHATAGIGVYAAIDNFISYLDSLGTSEKARIPTKVKKAIELLRDVASNPTTFDPLNHCIDTRGSDLESAISDQKETLSTICLKGAAKTATITKSIENLAHSKTLLLQQLDKKTYEGLDQLSLTIDLIHHFKLPILFDTFESLDVLTSMTAQDIQAISSDELFKEPIVSAINTLENLVILSVDLPLQKLKTLLETLGEGLRDPYFNSAADFSALLLTLSNDRRELYWQVYHKDLRNLIKNGVDLGKIFDVLTLAQQTTLYEEIKPNVSKKLTTIYDVIHALKHLSKAQRHDLYSSFIGSLRERKTQQTELYFNIMSINDIIKLHEKVNLKITDMSSDPIQFTQEMYWAYGFEMAKTGFMPTLKRLYLTSYEQKYIFYETAALPIGMAFLLIGNGFALLGFAYDLIRSLLLLEFDKAIVDFVYTLVLAATLPIVLSLTALSTVVIGTSIIARSVVTAVYFFNPKTK